MTLPLTPCRLALAMATALLMTAGTAQAQGPVLQLISSDLTVGKEYPQHIQTTDQQGTVPFYERTYAVDWFGDVYAGRTGWSMKAGSSGLGWYEYYFEGDVYENYLYYDITNVQLRLNEDARVRFSWYGVATYAAP